MPRSATRAKERIELRVGATQKATIARAAAIEQTDVTGFILDRILPEARAVLDRADHIRLSERDTLLVLDLLENPPEPTEYLLRAARAERASR